MNLHAAVPAQTRFTRPIPRRDAVALVSAEHAVVAEEAHARVEGGAARQMDDGRQPSGFAVGTQLAFQHAGVEGELVGAGSQEDQLSVAELHLWLLGEGVPPYPKNNCENQ